MLSLEIVETEQMVNGVAGYLWGSLLEKVESGKKILLLLSGGSSVEVYKNLAGWFSREKAGFAQNLTVGLVDERYGPVGHADSNEKQIRETGFYKAVEEKGGKFLSVLTGKDADEEADQYESLISQEMKEVDEVWAVLGVGADGHTAGILPQKSEDKFEEIFPGNRLVAYYELPQDSPNPFKKRITLTPSALAKINFAIVVVKSQGKEEALKKILSSDEPIFKTPAVLLRNLQGTLFTDQKPS